MFEQVSEPKAVGAFIVHLLVATIGTLLFSGLLAFSLQAILGQRLVSLLALGPTFLLPIISGLFLGWFAARFSSRGATWIWVVPAVLLLVNIVGAFTSAYERKDVLVNEFGPHSRCTACLDETLLSAPLVGCIGYSVGSQLRKRRMATGSS